MAACARQVLAWEGAARTRVEVVVLDAPAMRRLNRRATGRRGLTDVISFAFPQPDGSVIGEVYVCPDAARGWLEATGHGRQVTLHQELIRLTVHGVLHLLGHDHPEGAGRMRSVMWRTQERYVKRLQRAAR